MWQLGVEAEDYGLISSGPRETWGIREATENKFSVKSLMVEARFQVVDIILILCRTIPPFSAPAYGFISSLASRNLHK